MRAISETTHEICTWKHNFVDGILELLLEVVDLVEGEGGEVITVVQTHRLIIQRVYKFIS
jgi:hypothetical protein